jgi:hypothetical protein
MLRITVRKVTGDEAHLEVLETLKISELKQRIEAVFHIPLDRQRLIYLGRNLLNDNATMSEMGISDNTVVHLVERNAPAPGPAPSSGSGNNNSAQQNAAQGRPPFMMPFGPLRVESVTGQINFPTAAQQQRLSPVLAESSREHRVIRKLVALLDSMEDALRIQRASAFTFAGSDYRLSILFTAIVNRITALHMFMFRMHVLPLQRGIQNQDLVRLVLPIVTKLMNVYDLFVQNYMQNFDRIEPWSVLSEGLLQAIEQLPERVSLPNPSTTTATSTASATAAPTRSNNPPVNGPSSTTVNAATNPIASMLGTFVTSFTQDGNAGRAIGNVVNEFITSTIGAVPVTDPDVVPLTARNAETANGPASSQSSRYQSSFQNQRADVPVQSTSYDFGKHGRFLSSCLEGLKDDIFEFFDSERLNSVPLVKSLLRSACRQVSNQEWSRLIDGDYRILSKVARCFQEVVATENVAEFVNQIEKLVHSELVDARCDINVFKDTLIGKCNVLLVIAEHNRENRLAQYTLFYIRDCIEDMKNNLNNFDLLFSNLFRSLKPLLESITNSCRIQHLKDLEDVFITSKRNRLEQMLRSAMQENEMNTEEINTIIEKISPELEDLFEKNIS